MTAVAPTNLQKIELDVTTAEGPSRVTIRQPYAVRIMRAIETLP